MNDDEKRFVEQLLDASLRHYASSEPPPAGLEGRVLAGVRARQKTSHRRTAWAWAMGVAVTATMIMLLLIPWSHRQPAQLPATAKASPSVSAPKVAKVVLPVYPTTPRRPPLPVRNGRVDSRPQQFPTPRPLSEQEKLLRVYAQSLKGLSSAPAPDANRDSEHGLEIPPISIAAIKIEPLTPSGSGNDN